MPERTSVGTRSQFGLEVTSGTAVAANKQFDSFTLMVTPKENTRDFTAQGNKLPSYMQYTYGEVEAAIAGWPSYVADCYLWSGLYGAATIASVGAGSKSWTWTPTATDVDTPKTYTVQVGSSVRAGQFAYGQMTDIGWTWDRTGKLDITGKMTGQQYQDNQTLTSSPSLVADVPWNAVDYQVYLDTTSGGLGGTRLTRVSSASLALSGKYKPWYPSDRSQASYSIMVEQPYKLEHKLTLEADSSGMALLTHVRTGDHLWLRHQFQGAIMPGENVYSVALGSPSGGTFTLTYGGQTTSGIAYNATNSTVQTALTGLSSVGNGNATVSGSAGGPYTVTFTGTLAGSTNVLTGSGASLTGGTFAITSQVQNYLYQHDCCVTVASLSELKDDGGVYAYDATLTTTYDATWGKAQVLLMQNQLASL